MSHVKDPVLNRNHYGDKPQYHYFRTSMVMYKYFGRERQALTIDDKINIRSMNIVPVHFKDNTAYTFELRNGKLRHSPGAYWTMVN